MYKYIYYIMYIYRNLYYLVYWDYDPLGESKKSINEPASIKEIPLLNGYCSVLYSSLLLMFIGDSEILK